MHTKTRSQDQHNENPDPEDWKLLNAIRSKADQQLQQLEDELDAIRQKKAPTLTHMAEPQTEQIPCLKKSP